MSAEHKESPKEDKRIEVVPGIEIHGEAGKNQYVEIIAPRADVFKIINKSYIGARPLINKGGESLSSEDFSEFRMLLPPYGILYNAYTEGIRQNGADLSTVQRFRHAITLFDDWRFTITFS